MYNLIQFILSMQRHAIGMVEYAQYLGRHFRSPISICITGIESNLGHLSTQLKANFEHNLLHYVNNSIDDWDFANLSKINNRYELFPHKPLGSGTFASVFEAIKVDGPHVAIKLAKFCNDINEYENQLKERK